MVTCDSLKTYLDAHYNYRGRLCDLSNNPQIQSQDEVYDFDEIKRKVYGDNCTSADALWIKRNINLIEFKTGFDAPDDSVNERTKKENLQLKIRLKAYESLHLLQTAIINEVETNSSLDPKIQTVFCAVIDTSQPEIGEEVYTDILADAGSVREHKSFKAKIVEEMLKLYRKETTTHKKLFYDETFVLYDYEFDSNIKRFK